MTEEQLDEQKEPAPEGNGEEAEAEEPKTTDDTEETSEDQPEDQEDKPKKRNRPGKYTREVTQLREMVAELRGQLSQVSGNGRQQEEPSKPAEKPKFDDFDTAEDFYEALADWKVEERLTRERQQAETERQERERQDSQREFSRRWSEHIETGRDRYEDFDDVVFDQSVPITDDMAQAIVESDAAADVAYYLGSHPKEAARIAALSPAAAGREIGRIESRLSQPKERATTNAPEPIKRVKGGKEGVKDPDRMSTDEWIKQRNAGKI